jgi:MFS family permease
MWALAWYENQPPYKLFPPTFFFSLPVLFESSLACLFTRLKLFSAISMAVGMTENALSSNSTPAKQDQQPSTREARLLRSPETCDCEQQGQQLQNILNKAESDIPPDGGYGWVCVACCFLINANSWGVNSVSQMHLSPGSHARVIVEADTLDLESYGVFLSYYLSHNIFPAASNMEYAFVGGLSLSCGFLTSPLATKLIDRYGTHFVLNLGVFFETVALLGASFATQTWHLFLTQGVCFGFGLGFLFVGSVGIIPQWFLRKRSVANGINAAGSGFGGLVYSLATGGMIPRLGLGWTFRILGVVTLVANLTAANLLKDRNKAIGSRFNAFDLALFKRPEFLLFLGWGVFTVLGYNVLLFSMPDFALSMGLTPKQGSITSAVLSLGLLLGRPVLGLGSDRFGRLNVATFLTALTGLLCLVVWILARSIGLICFYTFLVGCISGTYWATVSPVLAEIIGLKDLPSGLSLTWLVLIPPATVSEVIALALRDPSRGRSSYLKVQIYTGSMYLMAAVCLWLVRGWRVGEITRQERQEPVGLPGGVVESSIVESPASTDSEGPFWSEKDADVNVSKGNPSQEGEHPSSTWRIWNPVRLLRQMVALRWV